MGNRSPLDGKVVLVVDDEPDVLDTVAETLDMTVVHKAENFDTALDCLQKNSYDLVILDIMGVNGFELLKHAVAKGFLTVMLTAHAVTLEALRESMKLGAAAFLPKEYIAELKEVLEDVIQGRKIRFWWRKSFDRTYTHSTNEFGSSWQEKDACFRELEESLKKKARSSDLLKEVAGRTEEEVRERCLTSPGIQKAKG
jgi:DNA-binding NtrC family response regulator